MAGEWIVRENGQWLVPDKPIICFIEGDGIGPEVWGATRATVDAVVQKSYGGKKKIVWQ